MDKIEELLNVFSFRRPKDLGILKHCLLVGAMAEEMASHLALRGITINPETVGEAGRYHDLAKMNNGPQEKEHVLSIYWHLLTTAGKDIAEIVICHEPYSFSEETAKIYGMELDTWEKKILFLADLRVSDRIMSWNERIRSIIAKYRTNNLFPPGREEWLKATANETIGEIREIIGPWDFLEFTPYAL
ncbi:hypothetical protein COT68_02685 [bacterium (Candidatus Torokbacteria) CG09_land_8_20_14_0_10_42_11]|uniref:HD domain-containing protein n=1 Tax=Candidatus Nealsonbacteria bacterium CG08_land_8_20_14_0_20_38_20 TaxID=1974705 RepID=A0A2H0YLY8_9BACT|nr:MAG: hypothetical protein COT33_02880 [Candidatus Nealsonbacteria bacterium CG08_land_8_20_14_0_20_38_20]PIU01537.1 MAG: hypothetical protein COT68_02685 [bacterium (Candidatus Torokbacteria) CG09_land_8_20_14_0_10_42_11]